MDSCPQSVRASSQHLTSMQGWEELALVVESAIAGRSKEVALAALACITGLVAAQGTACPPLVWRRSLRALGVGIEAATSPLCLVPLQVNICLLLVIRYVFACQRFLPTTSAVMTSCHYWFGWPVSETSLSGLQRSHKADQHIKAQG